MLALIWNVDQQGSSFLPQRGFQGSTMPLGMYGMNSGFNTLYQGGMPQTVSGKGKGKEIDFEAAFAQVSESLTSSQNTTSGITEVKDDIADIEDALKATTLSDGVEGTEFRKFVDRFSNVPLPLN
jgi:peroxin-5